MDNLYTERKPDKVDKFIDLMGGEFEKLLDGGSYRKTEIIRRLIERIIENDFCYKGLTQAQKQEVAEKIREKIVDVFDEFALKSMLLRD